MQRLIYSLAVLLGLSLLLLLGVNYYNAQKTKSAFPRHVSLPALHEKAITKIDIQKGSFHIVLEKKTPLSLKNAQGKKPSPSASENESTPMWVAATEDNYPVDRFNVSSLLDTLKEIKEGTVVSRSKASYPIYKVDSPHAIHLRAYEGGKEAQDLWVGENLKNYSGSFIRLAGRPEVLKVGQSLQSLIYTRRTSWLDRSLFRFNSDDAYAFDVIQRRKEGKKIVVEKQTFEKEGGQWWLKVPFEMPMDNSLSRDMASTLSYFDFEDLAPKKPAAELGLSPPLDEITCHYYIEPESGETKAGSHKEKETLFLKLGNAVELGKDQYYASASGKNRFFILSKATLDNFFKPYYDLMKKSLWSLSQDSLDTLTFQGFYPQTLKIKREDIKEKQGQKEVVKETRWPYELGAEKGEVPISKWSGFIHFLNQIKVEDYKEKVDISSGKTLFVPKGNPYHIEIWTTTKENYSFDFYPDPKTRTLWARTAAYPVWIKLLYSDYEQLVDELDDLLGRPKPAKKPEATPPKSVSPTGNKPSPKNIFFHPKPKPQSVK